MENIENSFARAFAQQAFDVSNMKYTENGALARKSTADDLVDLFGTIGALRTREVEDIRDKFAKAFKEDKVLATKMAFYARNVRGGGLGERRTGRICLYWLAEHDPEIFIKNIALVPFYGRWDDLYEFLNISEDIDFAVWHLMSAQICQDLDNFSAGKPISLLAKWLKSPRASSKETRILAARTAKMFGITSVEYRHMLSMLRRYLNVTEVMISDGKYSEIEYSKVPSYAMKIYRKTFRNKDTERFQKYLNDLKVGKTKINASTLYPYDLVEQYGSGSYLFYEEDPVIEAQWKALPNYVEGENSMLVMADVSGSMIGRPMATSVGLAIYFAQRNKGAFKNLYMTFTNNPSFIILKDSNSLIENINEVSQTGVGYSTNLERAFSAILKLAKENHIPQEEMPKALVVISDMEINPYFNNSHYWDFVSYMEDRFAMAGYKLPKVVMWNVQARQDTFHATVENPNVQFISGSSPSAFKSLIRGTNYSAYELMVETLSDKMYDKITF